MCDKRFMILSFAKEFGLTALAILKSKRFYEGAHGVGPCRKYNMFRLSNALLEVEGFQLAVCFETQSLAL